MTLLERVGKMPVWKAGILVFFIGFFALMTVEELAVSRIFRFMDNAITGFENERVADAAEWAKEEKEFEAFNKMWDRDFEELKKSNEAGFKHTCPDKKPHQVDSPKPRKYQP